MKTYTLEDLRTFPVINDILQCPSGNYTAIRSFPSYCSFEGYKAHPGYPLLTFGGAGSINRTVYAYNVEGGPLIRAGCFVGTLEEFRAKVRADGDEMKSLQYLGFANIVAATWCPERVEK